MESFGARLRSAIEEWSTARGHTSGRRGAIRAFQGVMARRLQGRSQRPGDSYRAIMSYLGGASTPSVDWLLEAAAALGVRAAWLLTGEGYRTAQEELVGARITVAAQRAFEGLRAAIVEQTGRSDLSADTMRTIQDLARAYATQRGRRADDPASVYRDAARAVVAPLAELGVGVDELSPAAFEHYVNAIAETLRHTVVGA
jgi:hypothetical protein